MRSTSGCPAALPRAPSSVPPFGRPIYPEGGRGGIGNSPPPPPPPPPPHPGRRGPRASKRPATSACAAGPASRSGRAQTRSIGRDPLPRGEGGAGRREHTAGARAARTRPAPRVSSDFVRARPGLTRKGGRQSPRHAGGPCRPGPDGALQCARGPRLGRLRGGASPRRHESAFAPPRSRLRSADRPGQPGSAASLIHLPTRIWSGDRSRKALRVASREGFLALATAGAVPGPRINKTAGPGNSGRVIPPAPMRTQGPCVGQRPRTRMGRGPGGVGPARAFSGRVVTSDSHPPSAPRTGPMITRAGHSC